MGQRSPTELAALDLLVNQVDQMQKAIEVMAGQRSPTGHRTQSDAMISSQDIKQLKAQVKQLRATIVKMASQPM
jgi:hypothetical protein